MNCNFLNTNVVDLKDKEFVDMKAESLPVNVELSFGKLNFMPITIRQYFKLIDKDKARDEIALFAIQVTNKSFDAVYDLIYNANMEDGEILTKVEKLLFHELKDFTVECSKCKKKNKISIEGGGGDILVSPFRESSGNVTNKITFGNEGNN